jgi:organic radical activating enzyme
MSKLKVSQTFYSFQGEGRYTGKLAIWLRLFGCNLKCPGFSQPNPADPSTYIKPIEFDPKLITKLDDFPVVEYGCDTLYAIDPRFKHLRRDMEPSDVMKEIMDYLPTDGFGHKQWYHPFTHNDIHLCITGGEPLLQQKSLCEMFQSDEFQNKIPPIIQFETNGTCEMSSDLIHALSDMHVHFNVSLKLHNVSGEEYTWNANTIQNLAENSDSIDLKVVVNNSDVAWKELKLKYEDLANNLGWFPSIYIMPVGSSYDQQTNYKQIEHITKRAISEGYNISGRLHVVTLGNAIDA